MSTETTNTSSGLDGLKWFITVVLIAGAVYGNHYFAQESISLVIRVAVIVAVIGIALLVATTTTKGKEAVNFARESRMEVRKVVWPTRQESIQTTLIIVVFVAIISLFLWGIDFLLALGVNEITGV